MTARKFLPTQPAILGFDPGRDKCGLAVMGLDRQLYHHQVVLAAEAIAAIISLRQKFPISLLVMGDQTTAKRWKQELQNQLADPLNIVLVDERYTSLEARDRYWQMFPPKGLAKLLPQGLRQPPRPIDDIVAILLIERYLNRLTESVVNNE
ncbi:MAG: Holliday junction resolvase RuvX [Brasilonema octagenarum HA4186-MV1]|jgi:RNase H-fold protein (predicted Holliday junction resolvase)|uniref:Resolvase n=2 Tax=Brasilonema TaxID=383614 RepID=A0A856MK75_9CYAN|nr:MULTISPECIES: Holliday junction resolvase RuvX [Brasilonema]MBW4628166.1 Holliday junction resolvase RuvX [Brasilonema octagenarum HA4186-MV1]NMF66867.1 resolvase [Brasilonema octagenarum UFV-OR1]QDL10560.1 resolvase [Brasilonema sennae CENA114]QDL16904.1 resolvase [Brasilonema octagenarum UFV-E1]